MCFSLNVFTYWHIVNAAFESKAWNAIKRIKWSVSSRYIQRKCEPFPFVSFIQLNSASICAIAFVVHSPSFSIWQMSYFCLSNDSISTHKITPTQSTNTCAPTNYFDENVRKSGQANKTVLRWIYPRIIVCVNFDRRFVYASLAFATLNAFRWQ